MFMGLRSGGVRVGAFVAVVSLGFGVMASGARRVGASLDASVVGGGSGEAALPVDQWRADVAREFGLNVGYTAEGSSFGLAGFADGSLDFGAIDLPPTSAQLATLAGGRCAAVDLSLCYDAVPVTGSGVAFMFNLVNNVGNRVTTLNLTRYDICAIFTGVISQWNDPTLVASNPQLATLNRSINPVLHAENSGASYAVSQFCIATEPALWAAFLASQQNSDAGSGDSPEFLAGQPTGLWPQQGWSARAVPVAYDDGVANFVADPGAGYDSITFLPNSYAQERQFPVANVQNAAGDFVGPDSASASAGLAGGTTDIDGSYTPNFEKTDSHSYQPDIVNWALAPNAGFDPAKGATLARFLCWALTGGQAAAAALRHAPLPSDMTNVGFEAIRRIPGAPSDTFCRAGPPSAPAHLRTTARGARVDVSWSAADGHRLPISGYDLWGLTDQPKVLPPNQTHITLELSPGVYTFWVDARSAGGQGPSSTPDTISIEPQTGYWMLGADGHIYPFGNAQQLGNATGTPVAIAPRGDGTGYWITDAQGRVSHFGTAVTHGLQPVLRPREHVTTISATHTGNGYWLFTNQGRAFAYGDAHFYGDMSRVVLNGPIVASVATPTGHGYYMIGSDGGVFTFGDARFHGSTGNLRLNRPVVGIAPTPGRNGYWLVASDGGVFAFNAPFRGSMGGVALNKAVNGLVAFGNGYLMVASDGGVFDFSNKSFLGSLANNPPISPIIGIAAYNS